MRVTMPTPEQVRELPLLARVRVPPEWEDSNGHVNVQYHLGMYNMTDRGFLELLGITEAWIRTERVGFFDLEHHIWYANEVHVGDDVELYIRFTACNSKRVQGVVFLLNVTRGEIASAIEFLSSTADLAARRLVPLPQVIGQRLEELVEWQRSLAWPSPASGAIST